MPASRKVLIADDNISPEGVDLLSRAADLVHLPAYTPEPEIAAAAADVDGILVRACEIPASVVEAAPRLQVVSRHGVGYDNVDVEACTRNGIVVSITERANVQAVSEHAFACMLALANKIVAADAGIRRGEWERAAYVGTEMHGKVLGIFGLGRIGSRVARQAAAFQMEVVACDPYVDPAHAAELRAELVSAEALLHRADYVTLHVPLSVATHHLIGAPELEAMKLTAFLVNTSRGGIVDERAVCAALRAGRLAGAALDVFEQEPVSSEHPLHDVENLLLCSPHVAGQSQESMVRMSLHAAENILRVFRGQPPSFTVNPEVLSDTSRVTWKR